MKVLIVKTLACMASPGENNPRPAVTWLRLPALMVLGNFSFWEMPEELAVAKPVAKPATKLPTPRGEADAEEAYSKSYGFKAGDARYHCARCRRVEKQRGHRCGKK